ITRAQMAALLTRARNLPTTLPDPRSGLLSRPSDTFTDIATSQHRTAINAIAQADITRGCSNNRYCPNQGVTRAEMASFLARTMNLV
ncbi:MAG: S-layer homology domain-containing protein, partial [Egibacteraceae bacterium]